jgi:branched-chain amino acid transport system permease protein
VPRVIVEVPAFGFVVQVAEINEALALSDPNDVWMLGWLPGDYRTVEAQTPPMGAGNQESAWGIAGLAVVPIVAPGYLDLGTRVVILILCAMSLDLLVGYCGLVTLGHAAFFGVGAYAAGIFALRASAEPLAGLLAGGVAAAIAGMLAGAVLLRSRRLTLIMLSLATVLLLQEIAHKLGWLTGGADGLQGIAIGPVAGVFAFDLFGRV